MSRHGAAVSVTCGHCGVTYSTAQHSCRAFPSDLDALTARLREVEAERDRLADEDGHAAYIVDLVLDKQRLAAELASVTAQRDAARGVISELWCERGSLLVDLRLRDVDRLGLLPAERAEFDAALAPQETPKPHKSVSVEEFVREPQQVGDRPDMAHLTVDDEREQCEAVAPGSFLNCTLEAGHAGQHESATWEVLGVWPTSFSGETPKPGDDR